MIGLPSGPVLAAGGPKVPAPQGYVELIGRRPELSVAKAVSQIMVMDMTRFWQIARVQMAVNSRVRYRRDLGDTWRVAETEGDCEDIALAKLVRLLELGWPRGAMLLSMCVVPSLPPHSREWHLVLMLDTDHGPWILDNRRRYPALMGRLGYTWKWYECPGSEDWQRFGVTA